jgi:hypothetical protein
MTKHFFHSKSLGTVRPSFGLPFVEHVPRFHLKRKEGNDDYQAKLNCHITNDMNCAFLQRMKKH